MFTESLFHARPRGTIESLMVPGLDTREPPVHWAGVRYYAGLSLVARTWHTVGIQLTIAEQTQGKKLKLLSLHFPICKMGRITLVSQWRKRVPMRRQMGKEGIPWVLGHWAGTQNGREAGVKRTSYANPI